MSSAPNAAAVRGKIARWRRETAQLVTLLNQAPAPGALVAEAAALRHECTLFAERLAEATEGGRQTSRRRAST